MKSGSNKKGFNRVLNTGDVLVVAFGAMIGWGWVVSSGGWIQKAGVLGTVLGFLIGGIMIYFVGLIYAELTTAMPKCGGEHVFSYKAFGKTGSFVCTWAIILSYIGVVCFEACSFPTVLQYIFPGFLKGYLYTVAGFDVYLSWLVVAILVAGVITVVNIRGVKAAAILQTVLTIFIAFSGILLIAGSAIKGDISNLEGQVFGGDSTKSIIKSTLSVAVIAPFFLFGFDVIPQAAEEIKVPLKKLGKLLILSIVLAVAFYGLVVFAVGYAMNKSDIDSSVSISGLVTADAMAKVFNSSVMAKVLILGGLCGILTSWNSFLIGGSRAMYSLAEAKMIPDCFSSLHPEFGTPLLSTILIGLLSMIAPFFGRAMLVWISDTASLACCFAYFLVSLSFIKLRKIDPDMNRPYKIKHYRFVGVMAVLLTGLMVAMYILPNTGCTLLPQEWVIAGIWIVLGLVFSVLCKIKYKEEYGVLVLSEPVE